MNFLYLSTELFIRLPVSITIVIAFWGFRIESDVRLHHPYFISVEGKTQ